MLGAAVVGATTGPSRPLLAVALLVLSVVAVWVSVVDLDVHRIPDRASGAAALASLGYVVVDGAVTGQYMRPLIALGVGAAVGVFGLGVAAIGGAGLGDVKLLAALVPVPAYLGIGAVFVACVAMSITGLVGGALAVIRRRQGWSAMLPAGPTIMYGVLAGILVWAIFAP